MEKVSNSCFILFPLDISVLISDPPVRVEGIDGCIESKGECCEHVQILMKYALFKWTIYCDV